MRNWKSVRLRDASPPGASPCRENYFGRSHGPIILWSSKDFIRTRAEKTNAQTKSSPLAGRTPPRQETSRVVLDSARSLTDLKASLRGTCVSPEDTRQDERFFFESNGRRSLTHGAAQ